MSNNTIEVIVIKRIVNYSNSIFENIKHIDELGMEYWYARELQSVLGYNQWRSMSDLIERAKVACKESKYNVDYHFALYRKMIILAKGATRKVIDYKLSRYACYLIVMNGNPKKEIIAFAQTYFAFQTRKQELVDQLTEDEKRIDIRKKVRKGNLGLNRTAVTSGVKNLGEFHNSSYKGLYGGETADDIYKRKGLSYREEILDFMGSEELVDNLFRIVHTDSKLKQDKINDETTANKVHYEIGKAVRDSIEKMGGTMPETLPNPNKSINKIK